MKKKLLYKKTNKWKLECSNNICTFPADCVWKITPITGLRAAQIMYFKVILIFTMEKRKCVYRIAFATLSILISLFSCAL